MVAKIRPIMSSTYITLGSRTASPTKSNSDNGSTTVAVVIIICSAVVSRCYAAISTCAAAAQPVPPAWHPSSLASSR